MASNYCIIHTIPARVGDGCARTSPQLNFERSSVKHGLQNTQNDCHLNYWLSGGSRVHKIRFRPGFPPPDPAGGDYSASPDTLAGL